MSSRVLMVVCGELWCRGVRWGGERAKPLTFQDWGWAPLSWPDKPPYDCTCVLEKREPEVFPADSVSGFSCSSVVWLPHMGGLSGLLFLSSFLVSISILIATSHCCIFWWKCYKYLKWDWVRGLSNEESCRISGAVLTYAAHLQSQRLF